MVKRYFGLKDAIVKDSLVSIDFSKKPLTVVGGMAVQLYCKGRGDSYRNTLDLDLVQKEIISFDEFRNFSEEIINSLRKKKYQAQQKKGRNNHSLKVMDSQHKKSSKNFFINLDYSSPIVYEGFLPYLEKELEFSKKVNFEGNNVTVASLEEILPLKFNRITNYAVSKDLVWVGGNNFIASALKGNFKNLASSNLKLISEEVEKYQSKFSNSSFNVRDMGQYKIRKDLFDLIASARLVSDGGYNFNFERYRENNSSILIH